MTSPEASSLVLGLDSPLATLDRVGGKGASLTRMVTAGLPVPPGFHIATDAYRRFVDENHLGERILTAAAQASPDDAAASDRASAQIQSLITQAAIPAEIAEVIRERYAAMGADAAVAVRSSATAEDLPEMSFAGQLETYLNMRGADAVLDAVRRCWASLWTGRAMGYRARQGIRSEDVSIAVVVQRLVSADVAGVAFTANPVTGARDEVVINAAWGLGEAIVSGSVTPDTIVVKKQTGAIASLEIASKEVMTVRLPEGTREEPVPAGKRKRASLEPAQASELAKLAVKIEELYGQPMDIEWAMSAGRIYIVQARPITALPESRAAVDWKLPRKDRQYWRASVIEMLPDPLSPLFATLALPAWNEAYDRFARANRIEALKSSDDSLVTINEFAYYGLGFTAPRIAELLLTSPVLIRRFVRIYRAGMNQWTGVTRPRYANIAATWAARDLAATPATELLAGVREITAAAGDYYTSIGVLMGLPNMSEAIFTYFYDRFVKRQSDPPAPTFLLGSDSEPIRAEKSLYDLAMWARQHGELAEYLSRSSSAEISAACESQSAPIADQASWREFTSRLADQLKNFGHAVYDLDFAKSVPAEDPASQLETVKYFMTGQGRNPYERQAAALAAREQAAGAILSRLGGLRLRWFRRSLRWAQRWAPLREDLLAGMGLGWPVLRRMLREIGRRMVAAGAIADSDGVFLLKSGELEQVVRALDAGQPVGDYRRTVDERRETSKLMLGVTPPVSLPVKSARLFGLNVSRWLPARSYQAGAHAIKGIGASPGRVSGAACVIHGPEEFGQMKPGGILVAKITTPAWTPLFALASGIVTDVGGPLSHSSIVAREYGVPAVLGTGVATIRIRSGERITVDGNAGVVTVGR